jgi:hypothetical protein
MGEVLDAERALATTLFATFRFVERPRRSAGGLRRDGTDRLQQRGGRGVRVSRNEEIDRGQGLVIHAPAIVQLVVEGDLDHLAGRRSAQRPQGASEVDPVEAEDDVGLLEEGRQLVLGEILGCVDMQGMIGGERRPDLEARRHPGADRLGERDPLFPRGDVAGDAAGQDHGMLGVLEPLGRLLDEVGGRGIDDRRHIALGVIGRQRLLQHRLLHFRVEIDIDRSLRRGIAQPRRPQQRFARGGRGSGLVVPLGVVADDRALVGGGVDPIDPGPPFGGVDRPGGAEDDDGHAVAPGVEDRHGGVEQPDIGMHRCRHRLAGDLGVAVSDRDRRFLVKAQQHLRRGIADMVDQAVMETAIAGAGIECDIGNVEVAQHLGDHV